MPNRLKKIIILPLLLVAAAIQAQTPSQSFGASRQITAQTMPTQRNYAWWVEQNKNRLQQFNNNAAIRLQPVTVNRQTPVYRTYESFRQPLLLKYPALQKRSTSYMAASAQQLPVKKTYSFYQSQAAEKMQQAKGMRATRPSPVK